METKTKISRYELRAPEKECHDKNCPFHGSIKIRGKSFIGKVISVKASKTVTVLLERNLFVKKYEKYGRKFTKLAAHLPDCIEAKEGDLVKIFETRPISKTKHFVVVENLSTKSKE